MAGTGKYCPICGREAPDLSINRFGEYFDSQEHAEQYVKEVRAARTGAAATPVGQPVLQEAWRPRRRGC